MRLVSALIAAVSCAAAIGCGLSQEGIAPPNNTIFYPGAIQVDPNNGQWLYVVNSNSDLRYNDGTLVAVDLTQVEADRIKDGAWGNCPGPNYVYPSSSPPGYCCWDTLDRNVLNCDERQYVKSAVKIGSFGSAIEIQPVSPVPGKSRLFVGVRGNASITWADVTRSSDPSNESPPAFACNDSAAGFVECGTDHRVTDEPNTDHADPPPVLPDEPYALAIDTNPTQPLLYVGHLRGGFLSAVDLLDKPTLFGSFGSIFPGDINGSVGVTSLTVQAIGVNTGHVYATSRFLPRAGAFIPISSGSGSVSPPPNNNSSTLFLANAGDVFASPLLGAEARGIQVIPGINRTYLLQRTPPALVGFDTLGGQNVATDVVEMCQGPTFLHMSPPYRPADVTTGATDTDTDKTLFVTCFEAGEVYVVDPYTPQIISIIEVGRGPAGLAFGCAKPPCDPTSPIGLDRAYVVGFGANNVSVIDLAKDSPTRYHVIERIGFPSPVPR
jgi:YVTN family beta-propeller protein